MTKKIDVTNAANSLMDGINMASRANATNAEKAEKSAAATKRKRSTSTNRKAKQAKTPAELRSKRKQILITPETDKQLNLVARIKGTSQNEIINEAVNKYLKNQMKNATIKELVSKLSNQLSPTSPL